MSTQKRYSSTFDSYTNELFETIFTGSENASLEQKEYFSDLYTQANNAEGGTEPLVSFFPSASLP